MQHRFANIFSFLLSHNSHHTKWLIHIALINVRNCLPTSVRTPNAVHLLALPAHMIILSLHISSHGLYPFPQFVPQPSTTTACTCKAAPLFPGQAGPSAVSVPASSYSYCLNTHTHIQYTSQRPVTFDPIYVDGLIHNTNVFYHMHMQIYFSYILAYILVTASTYISCFSYLRLLSSRFY